jgi:hypothetical protein
MTVRQLFLPGEYWGAQGDAMAPTDRRIQSFTVGYEEDKQLSEHVRVQLGSLYDTVSFERRIARWSPFARVAITPYNGSRLTLAYTAANPRILPSSWPSSWGQRPSTDQWLAIPQLSSAGSDRPVLEGGQHLEAQWEQQVSAGIRVQGAAFYDRRSETALSVALAMHDDTAAMLLRDPFSNRYFVSGGDSAAPGARVAVASQVGRYSEVIVGYTFAETLEATPEGSVLVLGTPGDLRGQIEGRLRHSVSVRLNSELPISHTRVAASYRWLRQGAVAMSDPYDRSLSHAAPYLNVFVMQPLPSPGIIPGQLEAIADFGNLLAQGYIPVRTASGNDGTLFPVPRSFRGGFNFIF